MINKKVILKSAMIITLATLMSKVLGLVRQQYSIYLFGGGWEYDSFVAAFRIPNALRELLAEGALSAAFIPLFSAILIRSGKKPAFEFANKVLSISIIITFTVSVIGVFSSYYFMPYYHNNPQFPLASHLAMTLFDIMMFYLPFISLSALMMGMLNSMDKFTIPALGPFFSNITFLAVLAIFAGSMDITALAYATIAGGISYFIIQIPVLWKSDFRFKFNLDLKDSNIKEFFLLFFPFALAMGIPKLNNILSNLFSDEITGANTALAMGFFVIQLPLSVFVAGISMVSLPKMSKLFEEKNIDEFKNLILLGIRMVLFFTLPSVIGLMLLDLDIARFIYSDVLKIFSGGESGKIEDWVIQNISIAQFYFAPGIIAMGLSIIFIRALQSMKDMRTMIYTGIATVILHLVLMTVLVKYYHLSFKGIAISISVSSFFNLMLLIIISYTKIGSFKLKSTFKSLSKMLLAVLFMGITLYVLKDSIQPITFLSIDYIENIIKTLFLITTGAGIYALTLYILKEEEFSKIVNKIVSKLIKR